MKSINCVSAHSQLRGTLTLHYYLPDLMELPYNYVKLDGNRTYLSSEREDSVSGPIVIQRGFPFGNSKQTTVYVCA